MIKRLLTASILIPLVLAAIFWAPLWLFLLIAEAFMLVSLWELLRTFPRFEARPLPITYLLTGLLPLVWVFWPPLIAPFLILSLLLISVWTMATLEELKSGFPTAAANLFAMTFLGAPFAILVGYQVGGATDEFHHLQQMELLIILVAIWVADSGAYFAGRWFGRRKITPRLSPNKSLEGYVAGPLSAGLAVVLMAQLWLPELDWLSRFVMGLLIGGASICGDLFESLIKRGAGVKDMSELIPGHGGVLDRVDSMLFVFPVHYLFTLLISYPHF